MWETGGMKSIDVLDAQALILVRAGDQLRLSAGQEMRWNLSINRDRTGIAVTEHIECH